MQLLLALARDFQVSLRCLLGLLDESMHDDNPLADQEAIARATYCVATSRSKFEKSVAQCARVRQPQIRAELDQKLRQARIVSEDVGWP